MSHALEGSVTSTKDDKNRLQSAELPEEMCELYKCLKPSYCLLSYLRVARFGLKD